MNETEIMDLVREAIILTIKVSAPVMLIGLVVGVSIALVQALTQIQEVTLVFVPKILAIFMGLFFFFPMMTALLVDFMHTLADRIVGGG